MLNYCISVDWLQVYCRGNYPIEGTYQLSPYQGCDPVVPQVTICLDNLRTPIFDYVFKISYKEIEIATLMACPKTQLMPHDAISIKLHNRVLYSARYVTLLYQVCEALHITIQGITRIDLCYDCNEINGYKNVADFLMDYISKKPGKKGHIRRKGSARFSCNGSRDWYNEAKITSMRWGSMASDIGAYCYDKTLELLEVKDKPWIREMWEMNGIQYEYSKELGELSADEIENDSELQTLNKYVVKHVWRFEISIKAKGTNLLNIATNEMFRLSPNYVENQEDIERLFRNYAAKVFDFRINTGQKNVRFYKKMEIFGNCGSLTMKPYYIPKGHDTGRAEKTCLNKLSKLQAQYTDLSEHYVKGIEDAKQFIRQICGVKSWRTKQEREKEYLEGLKAIEFVDKSYIDLLKEIEENRQRENDLNRLISSDSFYP